MPDLANRIYDEAVKRVFDRPLWRVSADRICGKRLHSDIAKHRYLNLWKGMATYSSHLDVQQVISCSQ